MFVNLLRPKFKKKYSNDKGRMSHWSIKELIIFNLSNQVPVNQFAIIYFLNLLLGLIK